MAQRKRKVFIGAKPYIVSFLSDYGFKVTFADKANTLFARKSLELILEDNQPIDELKFLRNEFEGISAEARAGLYDVVCQDEHKRVFIIEMQVDNYEDLLQRLQYYAFQIFTGLAKKGNQGFKGMTSIHCICIIKGSITESVNYHQVITLKNEDNEIIMDNLIFHLIELGKFPIAKKDFKKQMTEKEELFYTMKYAHSFDPTKQSEFPSFWEKEYMKTALVRLDLSRMSPLDRALYENSLMRAQVIENKQLVEIKKAEERAIEQTKKESVKNLLSIGVLTTEQIAQAVAVSADFIKKVKRSLATAEKRKRKSNDI